MVGTTRFAGAAIASIAAAGLVLAGCSSSNDSSSASSTTSKTTGAAITSVADDAGHDVVRGGEDAVDSVGDPFEDTAEIDGPEGKKIKVVKPIKKKIDELGGTDEIGLPTKDQQSGPDNGKYLPFEDLTIYWTDTSGAQAIPANVVSAFDDHGGLDNLGYPIDEGEKQDDGSTKYRFQSGEIHVSADGDVSVQANN